MTAVTGHALQRGVQCPWHVARLTRQQIVPVVNYSSGTCHTSSRLVELLGHPRRENSQQSAATTANRWYDPAPARRLISYIQRRRRQRVVYLLTQQVRRQNQHNAHAWHAPLRKHMSSARDNVPVRRPPIESQPRFTDDLIGKFSPPFRRTAFL